MGTDFAVRRSVTGRAGRADSYSALELQSDKEMSDERVKCHITALLTGTIALAALQEGARRIAAAAVH